tara:strand:+ start:120 stop:734 length:615 start_codon:yes stop_codon:yes gene_type:complete
MKSVILGIAGGTGSGKTFIVNNLLSSYTSNHINAINLDSYYKDLSYMDHRDRAKQNFDHPDSIDIELIISHLKHISNGNDIDIPTYDFSNHVRLETTTTISQSNVIIVEGIFALHYMQLRKLYTLNIFIETSKDIRFQRRLNRDTKERGRTIDSIKDQFESTVLPMHEKFIRPSKRFADLIIDGDSNIKNIIRSIKEKVDTYMI